MSGDFTVGMEEEYQLVDPQTGELRSRARDVLDMDWTSEISPELQETMLEVGTHVCADAAELAGEIGRLRLQVASAAASQDLRIVAAGLHPFSRWEGHLPSADARYQRLIEQFGRVMRTEHVFGMHVHVAVPDGTDRIRLINDLRQYLPHLIALAASSPFYEAEDTHYASYRTILTGRLPHSGIPPRLESEREFDRYIALLQRSGTLEDLGALYWSLRPHATYPTVEFRATDVCPRAADAVAIASLIRAMVAAAAEGKIEQGNGDLSRSAQDTLVRTNEWHAARYGLHAVFASSDAPSGKATVRESILHLLDSIAPVAEALGDTEAVMEVHSLLERGSAADRIRDISTRCEDLSAVVDWLARESVLGTGLDRRTEQRENYA
jgi:carboxylate-amine ligase